MTASHTPSVIRIPLFVDTKSVMRSSNDFMYGSSCFRNRDGLIKVTNVSLWVKKNAKRNFACHSLIMALCSIAVNQAMMPCRMMSSMAATHSSYGMPE